MKQRHIRPGDRIEDDKTVVVRGGEFVARVVRADAQRMFDIYGVYGVSVLALRGAALDELAQQTPLVRFPVLTVTTAGAIRAVGLDLEATGRNPHHYTVLLPDLDAGIESLERCDRTLWNNPYHEE